MKMLLLMLALLLCACSQPDSPSVDYARRLNNVLNTDQANVDTGYLAFPELRGLQAKSPQQSLTIRQFLGLRQCKLHLVIAQRNSQIGKVATASQQLKNDLDILATGPDCLPKIDDAHLKATLANYLKNKQKQLPIKLWQALLAQAEYKAFWQVKKHQPDYPKHLSSGTVLEDIKFLDGFVVTVLKGHYQISDENFKAVELALGRLRYGDAGQLLSELSELNANLSAATKTINARLTRKLCTTPAPNQAARYLQNVVNKFFIAKVQTHALALRQRHDQLLPAITQYEMRLTDYANTQFKHWLAQRQQRFHSALNATFTHAKQLQRLYAQCGLVAGNTQ